MLELKNISKIYSDFQIQNISFKINKGEYFIILGLSGAGKSVLLEIIAGLIRPDEGHIFLNGKDITTEKIQKRKIALVHQEQTLFPHLNVFKNIAYGFKCKRLKYKVIKNQVKRLAQNVGLSHLLEHYPTTLSGGECQRVALARAIATEPACLLLDEPLSSLDTKLRYEMRALLRKIHNTGKTMLHVTHDYEEAVSLATKIAIIEQGSICQIDKPEEIFKYPKSEFVASFCGIKNFIKGFLRSTGNGKVSQFRANGLNFFILTNATSGEGYFILRSEDIIISRTQSKTSALNSFKGIIIDIAPARLGIEITVDIGIRIAALITKESYLNLDLKYGDNVWLNFKASAGKIFSI